MVATSRRLAPDPVAEMAEQERADRPGEEGDAEGQIGVECLGLRRRFGEEHIAEHQRRGRAEDVEIVEFDRRADQARQHDLADAGAPRVRARRSLDRRQSSGPPPMKPAPALLCRERATAGGRKASAAES